MTDVLSLLDQICVYLNIFYVHIINVHQIDEPVGRVPELEAVQLQVVCAFDFNQLRSTVLVLELPFSVPPAIAETVDNAAATNRQVLSIVEFHQAHHFIPFDRPFFIVHGGLENAINLGGGIDAWSVEIDPSIQRY